MGKRYGVIGQRELDGNDCVKNQSGIQCDWVNLAIT